MISFFEKGTPCISMLSPVLNSSSASSFFRPNCMAFLSSVVCSISTNMVLREMYRIRLSEWLKAPKNKHYSRNESIPGIFYRNMRYIAAGVGRILLCDKYDGYENAFLGNPFIVGVGVAGCGAQCGRAPHRWRRTR